MHDVQEQWPEWRTISPRWLCKAVHRLSRIEMCYLDGGLYKRKEINRLEADQVSTFCSRISLHGRNHRARYSKSSEERSRGWLRGRVLARIVAIATHASQAQRTGNKKLLLISIDHRNMNFLKLSSRLTSKAR